MQRLCSIHTKYFKKSTRNKIKIKNIIAEAVIGGLFQQCSALKLSNSLQLLLRKLMSSQMSRKNLKVDQI
jgi:F0F1-type ATP synthase delta subunit